MSTVTAITDRAAIKAAETDEDREALAVITDTIREQIGSGVLMSLGAHNFHSNYGKLVQGEDDFYLTDATLAFHARILPFLKSGKRGTGPRKMFVSVTLNGTDYYDIKVLFEKGGELVEHFSATDVDAFSLARTMLALDYNGPEVLNPRYI